MTYVNPFHWQRPHYLNKFNIKLTQTLEQDNYQGTCSDPQGMMYLQLRCQGFLVHCGFENRSEGRCLP